MKVKVHKKSDKEAPAQNIVLTPHDIKQLGWFRRILLRFSLCKREKQQYVDNHPEKTFDKRDKRLQIIVSLTKIVAVGFAYMFALYCMNVNDGITPAVFSAALISAFLLTIIIRAVQYILAELNCLHIQTTPSAYSVNFAELSYQEMIKTTWIGVMTSLVIWCIGASDFDLITKWCDVTDNAHIGTLGLIISITILLTAVKTIPRDITCDYVCRTYGWRLFNNVLLLIIDMLLIIAITYILLILSVLVATPIMPM